MTLTTGQISYRTIDPLRDADLLVRHQIDACVATYGDDSRYQGTAQYLRWLEAKVEEFPEGFLLAFREDRCVGQLELEVPYGSTLGYVNLFYVSPEFRGIGFGRLLHQRAELYFRGWEASRVRLHVSPSNGPALRFYERMGYRRTFNIADKRLWEMEKQL